MERTEYLRETERHQVSSQRYNKTEIFLTICPKTACRITPPPPPPPLSLIPSIYYTLSQNIRAVVYMKQSTILLLLNPKQAELNSLRARYLAYHTTPSAMRSSHIEGTILYYFDDSGKAFLPIDVRHENTVNCVKTVPATALPTSRQI